jgi:endonuclease-3
VAAKKSAPNKPARSAKKAVAKRAPKAANGAPSSSDLPKHRPRTALPVAERATVVFDRLHAEYPDAHCELDYTNPFQLLAATILSAQCTDKRVNMVTPVLFKRYPTPQALAGAKQEDVEEIIKTTGFFRNKAKSLIGMATALVTKFGGKVPNTMAELVTVPGAGRKTANVVLGNAYGIDEGVVVDTHVGRLSRRLGFTDLEDPVKVEQILMRLFPQKHWTLLSHLLIFHGRRICIARRPQCEHCVLHDICPSSLV